MKDIVEFLSKKKIIFKELEKFDIKEIGSRKKIDIYLGIDTSSNYTLIVVMKRKSRFLQKDVEWLEEIFQKIVELKEHNFKKKIFIYDMPMCSKAQKKLKEERWKLIKFA